MTDHIPDVTDKDRMLARDWAEHIINTPEASLPMETAAARAILAAPAPPRPTLAEMTPEERAACRRMQADVDGFHEKLVIATPCDDDVALIAADGGIEWMDHDAVTPRPDLPRLTWPGTEKPAPAPAPALPEGWRLADHKDNGRVIVTNTTPNNNGNVYSVIPSRTPLGYDWHCCTPDDLTYRDIDQEADTSDAAPENTLAVGSAWDDADTLARACRESGRDQIVVADKDGDVFVWGADAGWWETGLPECDYAPFTIIHEGKKADQ